MQNTTADQSFIEDLLARIREGLIEGVRQEIERCTKLGIPLYVADDGHVRAIMPDDESVPITTSSPQSSK